MSITTSKEDFQGNEKSDTDMEAFPEVRRKKWHEVSESPRIAAYRTDRGEQLYINERSSPLESEELEMAPEEGIYRLIYSGEGISDNRLLAETNEKEDLIEYVDAIV